MSNTIKLLEAIGRDASLRHASPQRLTQALDAMNASEELLAAVSGGRSHLARDLGRQINLVVQSNQNVNVGGFDSGENDMESEPSRSNDDAGELPTPAPEL